MQNEWYKKPIVIILFLIFLFPIGLFLMWKYTDWSTKTKGIVTAALALLFVVALASGGSETPTTPTASTPSPTQQTTVQQEAPKEPAKPYEEIDTEVVQGVRAYAHYQLTGSTKPSIEDVKMYMVELNKKGCGEPTICNFFLWDSKAAYEAGKDSVKTGMSSQVATNNKEHLAGYVNSGYAFYYYGATGDGSGNLTVLDPDTGTYTDF